MKNTGRCRELLIPGYEVILEESGNPARKTKYDLVSVVQKRPVDQYGFPGAQQDRRGWLRDGPSV